MEGRKNAITLISSGKCLSILHEEVPAVHLMTCILSAIQKQSERQLRCAALGPGFKF